MTVLFAAGGAALGSAGLLGASMGLGGGAMLGLGIGSALNSSRAAGSAAQTQAAAADRAAELQKQQFDKQMELQDPFRKAGLTAQNRLMTLLGLGGQAPSGALGTGTYVGDDTGAADYGLGGRFRGSYGMMGGPPTPSGPGAFVGGDTGAADYGKYARDFSMADYQADPGYAFRLSEGQKALDRQAAARGGLISGGALRAATRYGQEMGSQEYGNAFNRYQTNRANQLQPLGSLMSSGQAAASNQAGQAGQYGVNAGNLMTQAGQATAAGQMGAANSLASGLGGAASAYQQQSNFNNWLARQSRVPPAYTGGYTSDAVYGPYEG